MTTTTLPPRIAQLPKDKRGYPIPWNVLRGLDGSPLFTINDDRKSWRALKERLCPICGGPLGRWKWFIGGPLSAFSEHGWYLDLPGHHECMQFALATCPYLAAPKYLGRVDVIDPANLPPEARFLLDETVIPERPAVFVAVAGNSIEIQKRGLLQPYVRPARPVLGIEFWRQGKQLTEAEALPLLQAGYKVPE